MLEEFLNGTPSIYDLTSFVCIVILLCVSFGLHRKQIKHDRLITTKRDGQEQ